MKIQHPQSGLHSITSVDITQPLGAHAVRQHSKRSTIILQWASFCILAILLVACPHILQAQNVTASITGTVTDSAGAVVPGAKVTAHDIQRGTTWPTQTNAAGVYVLTQLAVGDYDVKVEAPGFSTALHPAFTLVMNQTARLDFTMTAGKVSQTVNVNTAPPLLQTETTELGTLIDAHTNVTLPLATRNYNQLTLLSPGAVSTNPGSFTGAQTTFQSGRPYVNGNREQTNDYLLDGMDNNQIDNNDVAYAPSVDSIQEFNLISQNPPASYGNYLGGIISVTTKSGTNQFHGGAFEFIRNDVFNANEWGNNLFHLPKAKLRWNEFGADIDGPIIKDKLFFFVDYQGSRFDQPGTTAPFTVFTTAERKGDFSDFCPEGFNAGLCLNPAHQLYNPFSSNTVAGRQPFANNQIPNQYFSKAASSILNSPLYPEPINSGTTGNQTNFIHSNTNSDQGDLKLDWIASQKDHIYARYSQQHVVNPTTNSQQLLGDTSNNFPLYNGVISWSRIISPSLVNEVRGGFSYYPVSLGVSNPTGQNLATNFGIAGAAAGIPFLPQISLGGGFIGGQAFGNNDALNQFNDTVIQAEDELTWVYGQHSVHTGFQYFHYKTDIFYPGNEGLAGEFQFNGQYTDNGTPSSPGMGEADFLMGLPNNLGLGANTGARDLNNELLAAYVQDDWHAASKLTLNLGLRWELSTPRTEAHNQETNYGLTSGQVMLAGQNGASKALYNQYNGITNFQPRIGASYELNNSTVLRAAYGISNFTESTGTGNLLFQNAPWAIPHNVTYNNTQALPGSTLDQGFTQFPTSGCTAATALQSSAACFAGATIHAFDPNDVRPAVSQQYNLMVQHQFGQATTVQVGYVGQHTDHLMAIYLINQKVLNPDGTTSPSPFLSGNPTLHNEIGQARMTQSSGFSNYNGLQASLQHRLTQGLETQLNYTWSKCMTNSSGFFAQYGDTNAGKTEAGNDYFFVQNTYDPKADYGLCPNNVASDLNGYVTYDLPVGRGRQFGGDMNRFSDAVIGGWQANAILNFHTGFPITAQAVDQSGTISGFPRANCNGSPHETPYKKATGQPGYQWLDPSSVSQPATGTFGNCSVGSFRGPGLKTVDFSLTKIFPIVGSQDIQLRAEAINVTNTPILVAPADRVGPNFGLIQASQGARNLQFAVKYMF